MISIIYWIVNFHGHLPCKTICIHVTINSMPINKQPSTVMAFSELHMLPWQFWVIFIAIGCLIAGSILLSPTKYKCKDYEYGKDKPNQKKCFGKTSTIVGSLLLGVSILMIIAVIVHAMYKASRAAKTGE